MNWWIHSGRSVSNSTLQKPRLWQLKRNHRRHRRPALVWRLQCWTSRRPISGWVVCCRRKMQADDRTILTTDYKVRPVHSMFTNGFSVTKWFQWHLDLKFFDAMITSVVCFAAGHRKIYTTDLRKLDVHCRKLLRRVVGPPADIDWNQPWHTILHAWHRRIDQQLEYHGFKMWSTKYLSEYWKFANYVALLDDNRWVKRILHWNPGGGRPGRPFFQWQTPVQKFCRWHRLGTWLDIARNTDLWFQYYADFISFVQTWCCFHVFMYRFVHTMLLRFTSCALNGPPLGIQDQSQKSKVQFDWGYYFQTVRRAAGGHSHKRNTSLESSPLDGEKNVWHNVDWWKPRVKIINPSNNYTCKMYAGYNIGLTLRASKLWLDLAWPAVWTVTFVSHISGRNYRRMIRHPWSWWNLSTKAIFGACTAFQLGILEAHTKKRMIPKNIGLAMICIMNPKCGQPNGSVVAGIGFDPVQASVGVRKCQVVVTREILLRYLFCGMFLGA